MMQEILDIELGVTGDQFRENMTDDGWRPECVAIVAANDLKRALGGGRRVCPGQEPTRLHQRQRLIPAARTTSSFEVFGA
jgi:hypothetical protein